MTVPLRWLQGLTIAIIAMVSALPSLGQNAPQTEPEAPTDAEIERAVAEGEVVEIISHVPPGSGHAVDSEELERFEHDDIHKVLTTIPGVYIREEDGFGLRPNIGMRGTGSERSAKITLMEDGILSAPAPYAAPAAYYFPLVTRMSRIEVLKGPASIQHGPNTVGGALNLVSRPIPHDREITLDIAGGTDLYGKTHASYGQRWKHAGVLVEGVKLRSSGFKNLDGGGNTGFDKNDILVKGHANTSRHNAVYHEFSGKLGYSDEVSNETYTGLSDNDFANTPYRRYAATRLDRMTWDHLQLQLSHRVELSEWSASITTTGYRNTFSREWRKLNGFNTDRELRDILNNPNTGTNAVLYAVLTGRVDSSSEAEGLRLGTNARDFISQGVQSIGRVETEWLEATHNLELGVRLHFDKVDRFHFEDSYLMSSSELRRDGSPRAVTKNATGRATALAIHVQNQTKISNLEITAGVRTEVIHTKYDDHAQPDNNNDATEIVVIPGAGVTYQVFDSLGVVLGVHKGFAPAAPGPDPDVRPEESINYEAGFRLSKFGLTSEVIGFFSNYSNLKGTCTFSSGCLDNQIGNEFNGGRVHVVGTEVAGSAQWKFGPIRLPFKLSYTFNHARFQTNFTSNNPQWGDVESGDEPPYMPVHQLSTHIGIGGELWELTASATYTGSMRDIAGQGTTNAQQRTDASTVVNLAGTYRVDKWGAVYATLNNAFDQANIVSRRPYGARPGVPRMLVLGYKNTF